MLKMTRLEQCMYDHRNRTPLVEALSFKEKVHAVRTEGFARITAMASAKYDGQNYIPLAILNEMIDRTDPQPHHRIAVFDQITRSILDLLGCKDVTLFDRGDGFLATSMKFDIVIGNPPYQEGKNNKFYREFVVKAFDVSSDVVAMITPANWASSTEMDSGFVKLLKKNGLEYYKFLGDKAFNVQLVTVFFVCRKSNKSGNVHLVAECGSMTVQLSELAYFPTKSVDGINLLGKITDRDLMKIDAYKGNLYRNKAIITNPTVRCIWSAGAKHKDFDWQLVDAIHLTNGDLIGHGSHKVVMSRITSVGKLGELKYAGPEFAIANGTYAISVYSESEAHNLISYLNSKLVRFIVAELKGSVAANSQAVLGSIPKLDLSRTWTDAELYAHFDLTQAEIDYIERTIG